MANPCEVPQKKLQDIFDDYIKDLVFDGIKPVAPGEHPTLILLGGQAAAGKSSVLNGITERHGDDVAQLNPDGFRLFHPEASRMR